MTIFNRYLAIQVCLGLTLATAVLIPLFSFFDLQTQLDDVGTGSYRTLDAFVYTASLIPRRFIQLAPFIVLLGNVVTLGRLAARLELISLQGAGLSPFTINRAPLAVGLTLLLATTLMDQFLAPPLQQRAVEARNAALGLTAELSENLGTWTRNEQQVLRIGEMEFGARARDVEIFQFNDDGFLASHIHADYADIITDEHWDLSNVLHRTFDSEGMVSARQSESMSWTPFLQPQDISTLSKAPESLSPTELYQHIRFLRNNGQEARAYSLALWRRAGGILTTLAMMLLALPFVFGSVRQGLGNKLILASITGLSAYLFDQIIANTGLLLGVNPVLLAMLPGVLLLLIANFWLQRVL